MLTRLAAPAALIVLLGGCAATPTPLPTTAPIAAEVSCREYSNIMTLMANASIAHNEGRLSDLELHGAADLGVQMLADIPAERGTAIAESLAELQQLPSSELYTRWDATPGNTAWGAPETALGDACAAAGSDLYIMGWTGG